MTRSSEFRILPDIILLDMQLPHISGTMMLSYVRRLKRLKDTKVIILSGHHEMAKTAKALWDVDVKKATHSLREWYTEKVLPWIVVMLNQSQRKNAAKHDRLPRQLRGS
jgi:CheY-like chemotaxis protein